MFVGAMNPCKCGWSGHPSGKCTCSRSEIERYIGRISGPMLDRIDMHIEVPAVDYEELSSRSKGESSSAIRERVNLAREIQNKRFSGSRVNCNARMTAPQIREFCRLDDAADKLLQSAFERFGMTARSHAKILRVARTIADMENAADISAKHIAEALQYRALDRAQF